MSQSFSAVYQPDYGEVFNPKPVGKLIDPCIRHDTPAKPLDFARISDIVRSPDFADLFGEKTPAARLRTPLQK